MSLLSKKCGSHSCRETANEIKKWISQSYLIKLSFKGTVVNRALSSLNGGPSEISLKVPLTLLYTEMRVSRGE